LGEGNVTAGQPRDLYYTAQDGLRLHLRVYGSDTSKTPVLCLPGLARTALDFDVLAQHLSTSRQVFALDYRGRGLSDYDPDWTHYNLATEADDIITALNFIRIKTAIFIGTSRGGIHTMNLASLYPNLVRAAVLNDIGPVIEAKGLNRIKTYVGKTPPLLNWPMAVAVMKYAAGPYFPALSDRDWEDYARLTLKEDNGHLILNYDPALGKTLEGVDFPDPMPDLWAQFEALRHVPLMIIRGEKSDILSPQTLAQMQHIHPACRCLTITGQGHAPLLLDMPTIRDIKAFIDPLS
jgi:pimeloyl-ACP methyl ester carboxylesterase